jgi:hypothetical protein
MTPSDEDIKSAIGYMISHPERLTDEMKTMISSSTLTSHNPGYTGDMIVSANVQKATADAMQHMRDIIKKIEMLKTNPEICSMLEGQGVDFSEARQIISGKVQSSSNSSSDPEISEELASLKHPSITFTEKRKTDEKYDAQQE